MYGRVDRGGSREGKKSLRANKQVLHQIKTGAPLAQKPGQGRSGPLSASPAPLPLTHEELLVDCGARLIHRHFAADLKKYLDRAVTLGGVGSVVVINTDFEKQQEAMDLCAAHPGTLFCAPGIHPDSVKPHTAASAETAQLDLLSTFTSKPECVAICCGLDFARPVAAHHAQERMFTAQCNLASRTSLPVLLMLNGPGSVYRAVELLSLSSERLCGPKKVIVHCHNCTPQQGEEGMLSVQQELESLVGGKGGMMRNIETYVSFSGAELCSSDSDVRERTAEMIRKLVPKEKVLVASDAPSATPQTIDDEHVRSQPNEPANLGVVVEQVARALQLSVQETRKLLAANAVRAFNLTTSASVAPSTSTTAETTPTVNEQNEEDEEEDDEDESKEVESKTTTTTTIAAAAPATTQVEVFYSCKTCRKKLFALEDIKKESDEGEKKEGQGEAAEPKSWEPKHTCNMIFLNKALPWMALPSKPNATDEEHDHSSSNGKQSDETVDMDGKLVCPGCGAKVGRFSLELPLACSGKCRAMAAAPAFRVEIGRVDRMIKGGSVSDKFAALHLGGAAAAADAGDDDNEEDDDTQPQHKAHQKQKKLQTPKRRQNLSSFRNKG